MDTYEKKYKEALGWMKSLYNGLHGKTKEEAERYFPELKESEDEKIRNCIRICLTDVNEQRFKDYGTTLKDCFAWLEKQGEKKPQRMISAEAKEAMYDKLAWSEEDELVIKDIEEAITNYWHGYTQNILLDWLKSLRQRIEGE